MNGSALLHFVKMKKNSFNHCVDKIHQTTTDRERIKVRPNVWHSFGEPAQTFGFVRMLKSDIQPISTSHEPDTQTHAFALLTLTLTQ